MEWPVLGLRAAAAVRKMSPFRLKLREMRKFTHTEEHPKFLAHFYTSIHHSFVGIRFWLCIPGAVIWKMKSPHTNITSGKSTSTEEKVRCRWKEEKVHFPDLNILEEKCRNARSLLLSAALCWLLISSVCPDDDDDEEETEFNSITENYF